MRIKLAIGVIVISLVFLILLLPLTIFVLQASSSTTAKTEVGDKAEIAHEISEEGPTNTENDLGLTEKDTLHDKKHFDPPEIKAHSAIVWDMSKNEAIFEKNGDTPRPLASITKMMTAVVALEKVGSEFPILIEHEFLMQYGSSGLFLHERWPLENLAKMSMMTSANDASYAIAAAVGAHITGRSYKEGEEFFVAEMNRKADVLGLRRTRFLNSTGLDVNEGTSGAYSSPKDVVELTLYTLSNHPELLYSTRHAVREDTSLNNLHHSFTNTNPTVSDTKGILASKTGYTELAGGNLVIVVNIDLNYPVIIVVMGSSFDGRFEDTKKLIEFTRSYLHSS